MKKKMLSFLLALLMSVSVAFAAPLAQPARPVGGIAPLAPDTAILLDMEPQDEGQPDGEPQDEESADEFGGGLLAQSPAMLSLGDEEPDVVYTAEEDAAAALRNHMLARKGKFSIRFSGNGKIEGETALQLESQIKELALRHTPGEPTWGDYLKWQYKYATNTSIHMTYNGESTEIEIVYDLDYYTSAEQELEMDDWVADFITDHDLKNPTMTDYEKVKTIYDWICENVYYDDVHLKQESDQKIPYPLMYTAYAASHVTEGTGDTEHPRAVCQGYALLFYRLAMECGIDARFVSGQAYSTDGGGNHGWNIVKLYGRYFLLDATWEAGRTQAGWDNYVYFLRGSETFTKDVEMQQEHLPDEPYGDDVSTEDYSVFMSRVGDVNGSGGVDIKDVQALYTYLSTRTMGEDNPLDSMEFLRRADLNGDSVVNILDYQYLYEMVKAA